MISEQDFHQSHLPLEQYGGKTVDQYFKQILRPSAVVIEKGKPKLRKEEASFEEQRVRSYIDCEEKDMSMVYRPIWKQDNKERWLTQDSFDLAVSKYNVKTPWVMVQNGSDSPYIDGFEVTGDLSRKSRREKWIGRKDFNLSVKSDNGWSDSIRKQHSTQYNLNGKSYNKSLREQLNRMTRTRCIPLIAK